MEKQTFRIPEGCTEISIEQDGDMIITKFEKAKVEFKKGDILFSANDGGWIYIFKSKRSESSNWHLGTLGVELNGIDTDNGCYLTDVEDSRLATPSETQSLFSALAKAGKQWNAEKLCIEDLKVEPKVGDCVKAYYRSGEWFLGVFNGNEEVERVGSTGNLYTGFFRTYDSIQILTPTQFQSELSELGFEYDFETDKIKEKKWKPKLNEVFYYFDEDLDVVEANFTLNWKSTVKCGNCFKSESDCQSAIDKIKQILNSK